MEKVTSLFMNGGSQAVRLPKEFRFDGTAVRIRRDGERVILEPIEKPKWPKAFFERIARSPLSADFALGEPLPESKYRDRVIERLSKE